MSHRLKLAVLSLLLPVTACAAPGENDIDPEAVTPTSTIGRPAETFATSEVEPAPSTEINGERVKDPAMDLSYKWQGSSYAPGGGTVVVVAVTNESDAPLPVDALKPTLKYNAGGGEMRTAETLTADAAGVDIIGLDLPLGPGATVNAKYAFNVSTGNLWDAQFTIGNVTFQGNLNN
ncbi:hypothetical protein QP446_04800 [Corynebacterium riegelii]|uniref:hypothetical protein n=1 Tax=Corynebacterium riegelii TaxID=156976 RepID=UPI002550FBED|nr:hypothetical protein [Corynebacterium riegelii]MDK7180084.1 hypothetical protein [Corynebacterium riegelii]